MTGVTVAGYMESLAYIKYILIGGFRQINITQKVEKRRLFKREQSRPKCGL